MIKKVLAVIAVILIAAIGLVAYSFLKTPEEASAPIEAIPIAAEADESSVAEASSVTLEATEAAVEPTAVVEPEPQADPDVETATPQPEPQEVEASPEADDALDADTEATVVTETPAEASNQEDEPAEEMSASVITFEIVPGGSEARFVIDEVLRGTPKTVVGATDQVAGQLALDPIDLSSAQVGTIQVNARTLATDNDFRNRAVKNRILLTDSYEFVTFTPTEVIGLPETGAVGETYTFQIAGDLTITDVTRPVTFDVAASATSETQIEGTATTAFLYTDFDLFIPDAPAVDTVDDEVRLELDFVAEAVQ
jgi:polyisoprenoid-binding protein YceI